MIMLDKKQIYPKSSENYYDDWGFSPAIESNGFIFISGCTGTRSDGSVPSDIEEQTHIAFQRIKKSLDEAGIGFESLVDLTSYHVGLGERLEKFMKVKSQYIPELFPAWTAIGVSELAAKGALVEVRVIARAQHNH